MTGVRQGAGEIVLRTYDDVRRALGNPDLTRSLDHEKYEVGNTKDGTLSILHGKEHRDRRRVENVLFRRPTLELYERVVFPEVVDDTLARFVDSSRSDLREIGGLCTIVLAARIAGVDFNPTSLAERRRLLQFLDLFSIGSAIDVAKGDVDEIKALMRKTLAEFDEEFVRSSWDRRAALVSADSPDLPADLLTTLLRSRNSRDLVMDDPLMLREVTSYFTAGAHTSTQTMTNTLDLLFTWCQGHPDDWDKLADDLYFTQRAVQEALRCRPTNPMIHRRAVTDTQVGDHPILAQSIVLLDTIGANTDPAAYGPDAASFNPYRVPSADFPPYGTSFGAGMHLCIGRTLAVGMPVRDDAPGEDHLYGLVPRMVQTLIKRGVHPDPDRPSVPDTRTERWTRWASYPVRFDVAARRRHTQEVVV